MSLRQKSLRKADNPNGETGGFKFQRFFAANSLASAIVELP
jgi:hypothetical protein